MGKGKHVAGRFGKATTIFVALSFASGYLFPAMRFRYKTAGQHDEEADEGGETETAKEAEEQETSNRSRTT